MVEILSVFNEKTREVVVALDTRPNLVTLTVLLTTSLAITRGSPPKPNWEGRLRLGVGWRRIHKSGRPLDETCGIQFVMPKSRSICINFSKFEKCFCSNFINIDLKLRDFDTRYKLDCQL